MMATETAPHFEKITRALGEKIGKEVSEAELREQFEKFLEYGVQPEQAVRSILRQYGGSPQPSGGAMGPESDPVKLVDLAPNLSFVNLLVRVVFVTEREITVRGEPRQIWTGILGDDTGTRPFTSWSRFGHEKGQVLQIKGAYTKEFNNEIQINIGDRTEIREAELDALPEYERPDAGERPIGELAAGIGNVTVKGRVLALAKRTVMARGEEKVITTGTLADATGKIPFTAWSDLDLEEGQVVRVESGYIKAYRGVPQFNFDDSATIQVLADDTMPKADDLAVSAPVAVGEIVAKGGAADATIRATLIEVRPGSGLVFRCPEDNRVLQDGACRIHGKVEGTPDLRIKCVFDDGTGAISAVVNRDATERLLGRTLKQAEGMARDLMSWTVIEDELRTKLTGRAFECTGNAVSDDFGLMMIVGRITPLDIDVAERAAALAETIKANLGGDR